MKIRELIEKLEELDVDQEEEIYLKSCHDDGTDLVESVQYVDHKTEFVWTLTSEGSGRFQDRKVWVIS